MTQPAFTVDVDHNQYLPEGGRDVSAIATVVSDGTPAAAADSEPGVGSAEIIIVDCSGSMDVPQAKMAQARAATAAAVDVVRDGVWFAVIAGTSFAKPVYPPAGGMAVASPQTRMDAKRAVNGLRAGGGTAIGKWLQLAYQTFGTTPATLRHAILLTDGRNQHETPEELASAVSLCEGSFTCDCRGVGTDWEVGELRKVSTALLGSVDIVPDPAGLAADFEAMMRTAMSKQVADVALRVWTPQQAEVRFVKQVAPTVRTCLAAAPPPAPRWAITLPARGDPARAATTTWASGWRRASSARRCSRPGSASWSARQGARRCSARASCARSGPMTKRSPPRSTPVSPTTRGRPSCASAIQEGLEARKQGDEDTATARLGRAVVLAKESGNEDTARLLSKVVDVVDEATGTVQLKKKVADEDEMALDTRSTKTVRVRKEQA